jgi:hypothetical protein
MHRWQENKKERKKERRKEGGESVSHEGEQATAKLPAR